jgi:hypothetical protein
MRKVKIYIGYDILDPDEKEDFPKENVKKLFDILGEGLHFWKFLGDNIKEKVKGIWPVVKHEYYNCSGPKWSWYKRKISCMADAVEFGEMYQESVFCPFCFSEPRKCIHYIEPSLKEGLFKYVSKRHHNIWLPASFSHFVICEIEEEI